MIVKMLTTPKNVKGGGYESNRKVEIEKNKKKREKC